MKIAYLHGLESKIDQNDPKIIFLNQNFSEVYTPQINYRAINAFGNINSFIKAMKPDLIVGSSMGGYFAYLIGSKLKIPTVLFNPAVFGRSMEPEVDATGLRGTKHSVFFGKSDKVISGVTIREYFDEHGVGDFKYEYYNGGHRVPVDVFIDSISKISNIYSKNKSNNMNRVKLYEEFNTAEDSQIDEKMKVFLDKIVRSMVSGAFGVHSSPKMRDELAVKIEAAVKGVLVKYDYVVESKESDALAKEIDKAIVKIDDSMSYEDFALAVGKILKDEYGSHNYEGFMKILHKDLGI